MNPRLNGGIRPYGPGKFDTIVGLRMWGASLDGCDDECGDSGTIGWYGLLRGPFGATDPDLTPEERTLIRDAVGVIISETSDGFVYVDWYDDVKALDHEWAKTVAHAEQHQADGGENR